MIRLHLIMMLALAQAIFSERLVITLPTGGRGLIMITNLLDPWITLALVIIPFWRDVRAALATRAFLTYYMPFLLCYFLLPFMGVALTGYPARTIYASWNAIIAFTFMTIGIAGGTRMKVASRTIGRYFIFAIMAHLCMSAVQTMGQFNVLPGILRAIYEWDFHFKVLYLPHNVILGRATGFYLNPNSLGIWALLALWVSFFLLKGTERVVACMGSFTTILLCQSRGTMAAFLGSGAIYGMIWMLMRASRQERRKATLFVTLILVPATAFFSLGLADSGLRGLQGVPVVGRAVERYTSGAKVLSHGASADANFQGRTEFWLAAFDYLADHPFGSLGSPEMVIKIPPDNQFIAALEQGSFVFFGALLLVFAGGIRLICSPHEHARLLAVASLAMMINGVSAVPFAYPASFIYWMLVGIHLAHRASEAAQVPWGSKWTDPTRTAGT